jgi:enamine deaminase RidA (YjgF/YER057c/UK114 family)
VDGVYAGNGPVAQTETAMVYVKVLLAEAGAETEHIYKTTIYIEDYAYREPVYRVIGRWLGGIYRCSTGPIVAGLAKPELKMKLDVEATIPQ